MSSNKSNNELIAPISFKRDPGFALVIAFSYYDGPESGLAIYPNGDGVRFITLSDSRSGLYRSFKLELLSGNWWPKIQCVQELKEHDLSIRIAVLSEQSKEAEILESEIFSASNKGCYLSVGPPNFDWLAAFEANEDYVEKANSLGFEFVHKMLKTQVNQNQ